MIQISDVDLLGVLLTLVNSHNVMTLQELSTRDDIYGKICDEVIGIEICEIREICDEIILLNLICIIILN
jgi:hypothetical protein